MPPTDFDLGPEFQNANPSPPGPLVHLQAATTNSSGALSPQEFAIAHTNADAFQNIVSEVARNGGGYVYLPPGRYYVGRPTAGLFSLDTSEYCDLLVPASVTLWFAPGAELIPLSYRWEEPRAWRPVPGLHPDHPDTMKVRIEVHGDIIADLRPIFGVEIATLVLDRNQILVPGPTRLAGRILLVGDRVREVYPEWWGAASQDPGPAGGQAIRRTTLAVNAAIEAAYTYRTTPRRTSGGSIASPASWNLRASIPVVLMGTYVIDDEIAVHSPDDSALWSTVRMPPLNPGGFELLGRRSVGSLGQGVPNLVASAYSGSAFGGEAMLNLRGVLDYSIRGLSLNGSNVAPVLVSLAPQRARWSYCEFEGCTFLRPRAACARLDAQAVSDVGRLKDFWNILFTRCHFDQGDVASLRAPITGLNPDGTRHLHPIPDIEGNLVSAELRLEDNEGLEFRGCAFFGHASPAIRAYSGRFALNEANFHVLRAAHPALVAQSVDPWPLPPSRDPRLAPNFRHGTDIFLESDQPTHPNARRNPARLVPPAFTARELESQSWQFLATEGTALSPLGRDVTGDAHSAVILLNMHHAAVWNRDVNGGDPPENIGPAAPTPPGIFWGDPGIQGSPLVIIGCQFHGQYMRYTDNTASEVAFAERSVVYVSQDALGRRAEIYNIATHIHASWSGQGRAPRRITPATQDTLIRVYQPEQWHVIPSAMTVQAAPTIRVLTVRQLEPQQVRNLPNSAARR